MPDITIALSKQLEKDMLETRIESGHSIDDVLGRLDVGKASGGLESLGNSYYRIANVDPDKIDQLLEELRNIKGIEAAYVKPADELP